MSKIVKFKTEKKTRTKVKQNSTEYKLISLYHEDACFTFKTDKGEDPFAVALEKLGWFLVKAEE